MQPEAADQLVGIEGLLGKEAGDERLGHVVAVAGDPVGMAEDADSTGLPDLLQRPEAAA